jgi:hypothetical protein
VKSGISRRRFLILGGGTTLSALIGGAYVTSGCPLSDAGVCVGPCAAYIDLDRDGVCDRIQRRSAGAPAAGGANPGVADDGGSVARCPLGLREDPYPGQCAHYVDDDGDGYCDLALGADAVAEAAAEGALPVPERGGAQAKTCPFGLQEDPYPGQCKWYVDEDGDGYCDLALGADGQASEGSEAVPPLPGEAQDAAVACPFGLRNDPYPGQCRYYVDEDGDGICDLSVPGSATAEDIPAPHAGRGGGRGQQRRGQRGSDES